MNIYHSQAQNIDRLMNLMATYIPNASEADQGAVNGTAHTVKYLVDTIIGGTKNATILFTHSGTGNTTTYTFATSETIPSNIKVVIEKGALLQFDNGVTLTVNGPPEIGLYKVFTWTGTGKVVFGVGTVKEVYPQWWGAIADDSTDAYAAFSAMLASGVSYKTIRTIGDFHIDGSLDVSTNYTTIIVDGKLTWGVASYQATGYGLRLSGDYVKLYLGELTTDMKTDRLSQSVDVGATRFYVDDASQWTAGEYIASSYLWTDTVSKAISNVGVNFIDVAGGDASDRAQVSGEVPPWVDANFRAPKGSFMVEGTSETYRNKPLLKITGAHSKVFNGSVHNTPGYNVYASGSNVGIEVNSTYIYNSGFDLIVSGDIGSSDCEVKWIDVTLGDTIDVGKQLVVTGGDRGYHEFVRVKMYSNASDSFFYWRGDGNTLVLDACRIKGTRPTYMTSATYTDYAYGKAPADYIRLVNASGEAQKRLLIKNNTYIEKGDLLNSIVTQNTGQGTVDYIEIYNSHLEEGMTFLEGSTDEVTQVICKDTIIEGERSQWFYFKDLLNAILENVHFIYNRDGRIFTAGDVSAATNTTADLEALTDDSDDWCNTYYIRITAGTGIGQARQISDYDGTNHRVTVAAWDINPDATSDYEIYQTFAETDFGVWLLDVFTVQNCIFENQGRHNRIVVLEAGGTDLGGIRLETCKFVQTEITTGTAQAGAAATITLAAGASVQDDYYNNYWIEITGGNGIGQSREITDYAGSTKIATVGAWTVQPDGTSTYRIFVQAGISNIAASISPQFPSLDISPSVKNGRLFRTNNGGATTINSFRDAVRGQAFTIFVEDGNTTFDFTASDLKGNGGANWAAADGDYLHVIFNGSVFVCTVIDAT